MRVQHSNGRVQMVSETVAIDEMPAGRCHCHVLADEYRQADRMSPLAFSVAAEATAGAPEHTGFKS